MVRIDVLKRPGDPGGCVDAAETAGFRGVGTARGTGEAAGRATRGERRAGTRSTTSQAMVDKYAEATAVERAMQRFATVRPQPGYPAW